MTESPSTDRLRASPSFLLAFAMDGRPYVAKETEPYIQYWLTERYRVLLSMFSRRGGATASAAIDGYFRVTRETRGAAGRKRLLKAIEDMRAAGVLIGTRDDISRYNSWIVDDYVTHRPFPSELAELLIRTAPITASSRVLDLAGGPGDLALALAQVSNHVSLMEISRGFLNAARRRAKQLGLSLTPIHDSCNRLVYRDEEYDVVTVSQALHWLDDVLVARGICRVLKPGGSFFVIHGAMEVDDGHPLASVLGYQSVFGHKAKRPFVKEVQPLLERLTLLFEALDAPEVQRIDLAQQWAAPDAGSTPRIVPVGVSVFRQRRPLGMGYVRGFLTDEHITSIGQTPAEFWRALEARSASATPDAFVGTHHWAILHFRRGGTKANAPLESAQMVEIGFEGKDAR